MTSEEEAALAALAKAVYRHLMAAGPSGWEFSEESPDAGEERDTYGPLVDAFESLPVEYKRREVWT